MLDSCCISKTLSRVYKGQTGFQFRGLRFRDLGASFSSASFSIGASFLRFGCFVLRSSSTSFSKLPWKTCKCLPNLFGLSSCFCFFGVKK